MAFGEVRLVGHLIGLFSFDVGHAIDVERVRRILGSGPTKAPPERRRAAPSHLAYSIPPVRLDLEPCEVPVGALRVRAEAEARVHEFGAVSIVLTAPLSSDVDALPELTATLTGAGPWEDAARTCLDMLRERIRPAISKPAIADVVEDYYVIQADRLEPGLSIDELVARSQGPLASALRCEPQPLSDAETEDVFRTRLSYYPDDLVVTEWNVALVVDDTDYGATIEVLEYLNVQLVELRYYDALLDRRVADFEDLLEVRASGVALWNRAQRRQVNELAAIRLDVATIVERVNNALKLSGDQYLAKVYQRTADRLSLRAWTESVSRKLDVLNQMYEVVVERTAVARSEVLELTIIALIAVEIALFLAGWG